MNEGRNHLNLQPLMKFHGASSSEVAAALGIRQARFVKLLFGLNKQGLVTISSRPYDRRSHSLYLSREAVNLVGKLESVIAEYEGRMKMEVESAAVVQTELIFDWWRRRPKQAADWPLRCS